MKLFTFVAAGIMIATSLVVAESKTPKKATLTKDGRRDFIRRAQVWQPTVVSEMDLRAGPQGKGAFAPDALVVCDYVEAKLSGSSKKFDCAIAGSADGAERDVVKVRYGADNGEVQGSVLGSRLLWALGFVADRVYPVRVTCRGCSSDPWIDRKKGTGEQTFFPAVIERKAEGHEVARDGQEGWAWPELALVDETQGGAPRAHTDALKLLAVFMQHTDNKAVQQRLVCLSGKLEAGVCDKPFLSIHDVGLTFGHANLSNRNITGSVNFAQWAKTPIWRDAKACVGHMSQSMSGTLGDPKIGEPGRAFLSDLLLQLTDAQLRDLFEVAHADLRRGKPDGSDVKSAATVDEWVSAFKQKREEIATTRCPS